MQCKWVVRKYFSFNWSLKFVKRKDITPLSLHLFCFEEKMMHVGLWCRRVDGLYLTELGCSRLYLAELDCTRMHVVVQMGGRTAFQANLTHHL